VLKHALARATHLKDRQMNRLVVVLLLATAAFAALPAIGQDKVADVTDMQALRTSVKADKKAYVASVLKLDAAESKKFWPIYDAYQRDLDLVNRERNLVVVDLVGADKPLSDLYAKNLAKEIVLADDLDVKARRTLYNKLMKALPAKKAAQFLQLDAKIRAVQAYDVASTIPLIK
jgi:Spy/CpxP family protein refolding chaperone